ncbi:MAG: hypothetical protein LBP59_19375 [Planctomycetaceae bacterium]|nr:hypothetical protein [Planctomycetaceae bacterium]
MAIFEGQERRIADVLPAFPGSRGNACNSGSLAFRLCSFRFSGETPAFQDRGRPACKRLYSTADERGLTSGRVFKNSFLSR